jgi:hypothetical protein
MQRVLKDDKLMETSERLGKRIAGGTNAAMRTLL